MRCPNCNTFASLEFSEPEVSDGPEFAVADDGHTVTCTASVQLERTTECCGDVAKTADLSMEVEVDAFNSDQASCFESTGPNASRVWREGHGIETVEFDDVEQIEEGGGRYKKSYFGASIRFTVECKCGEELAEGFLEDKVAASEMEEEG